MRDCARVTEELQQQRGKGEQDGGGQEESCPLSWDDTLGKVQESWR